MVKKISYRILSWLVVILLVTNLSMGISFIYHKQQDKKLIQKSIDEKIELPAQQRTRFFREQLDLRFEQMETFRQLNRQFNRDAHDITAQLEGLRIEMVRELGKQDSDKKTLDSISTEIGELHTQLKALTIEYYLSMKEVCDENQQRRLNEIFMSVLQNNEELKLPSKGRKGRNFRE